MQMIVLYINLACAGVNGCVALNCVDEQGWFDCQYETLTAAK
jgi:hypothetical protein